MEEEEKKKQDLGKRDTEDGDKQSDLDKVEELLCKPENIPR